MSKKPQIPPKDPKRMRCLRCTWWLRFLHRGGECRRYPPVVRSHMYQENRCYSIQCHSPKSAEEGVRPFAPYYVKRTKGICVLTDQDYFCGEFHEKKH
jgi:hypothetical protein